MDKKKKTKDQADQAGKKEQEQQMQNLKKENPEAEKKEIKSETEGQKTAKTTEKAASDAKAENDKAKKTEEAQQAYERAQDIFSMDIVALMKLFITILSQRAWEYLGLIANPKTGVTKLDIKKSRMAIDTISFILDQIKDDIGDSEQREYRNFLTNLKMNFVDRVKSSQSSPSTQSAPESAPSNERK